VNVVVKKIDSDYVYNVCKVRLCKVRLCKVRLCKVRLCKVRLCKVIILDSKLIYKLEG